MHSSPKNQIHSCSKYRACLWIVREIHGDRHFKYCFRDRLSYIIVPFIEESNCNWSLALIRSLFYKQTYSWLKTSLIVQLIYYLNRGVQSPAPTLIKHTCEAANEDLQKNTWTLECGWIWSLKADLSENTLSSLHLGYLRKIRPNKCVFKISKSKNTTPRLSWYHPHTRHHSIHRNASQHNNWIVCKSAANKPKRPSVSVREIRSGLHLLFRKLYNWAANYS